MQKLLNGFFFTKFGGTVTHEPRKNRLDSGGNPDHVTPGLGLGYR